MKTRNSTFELLRIISMFFIILYHQIIYFIYPWNNDLYFKAVQIPLHVGVIIFILISGYWGIKASFKGFIKLILPVFVYYIGFTLIYKLISPNYNIKSQDFLFISQSPYWFIRTYIYLYLLSPFINKMIHILNDKMNIVLLLTLGFISLYMGIISIDTSLYEGKNIINFVFVYLIGHHINKNKDNIYTVNQNIWIILYILLNVSIIAIYYLSYNTIGENILWNCSFNYCSPLLITNAILFFIIFGYFNIHSGSINYIASSTFAMYIIHEHPIIKNSIIRSLDLLLYDQISSPFILFISLSIITIIMMFFMIILDKILTPIWSLPNKIIKN